MIKIFIDGSEGTTGLQIRERLQDIKAFEVLSLPENLRKNADYRKEYINKAILRYCACPTTRRGNRFLL